MRSKICMRQGQPRTLCQFQYQMECPILLTKKWTFRVNSKKYNIATLPVVILSTTSKSFSLHILHIAIVIA